MQISNISPQQQGRGVKSSFPGLRNDQIEWLKKTVDGMGVPNGLERVKKEEEVYKGYIQHIAEQKKITDKSNINKQMSYQSAQEKDPVKKKQMDIEIRINDMAQLVKEKRGLVDEAPNFDVFKGFALENPQYEDGITKYVNEGDDSVLYDLGLKKKNLLEKTGDVAKDFLGNAVAELPQTAMNATAGVLKTAQRVLDRIPGGKQLSGEGMKMLTDWMIESGNTSKEIIQEKLGVKKDTLSSKLSSGIAELIPSTILAASTAGTSLLGSPLLGATVAGAGEGIAYTATNNPNATSGDYKTNAVLGGVFGAAAKSLGYVGKQRDELVEYGKRGKVDDMTRNALSTITKAELEGVVNKVKQGLQNIDNPGAIDDVASSMQKAVKEAVVNPRKAVGKLIGETKKMLQNQGKAIKVSAKDAITKLDDIVQETYGAKRVVKKSIDEITGKAVNKVSYKPTSGGIHKFKGDQAMILKQLRTELKKVKSGYDISAVFDNITQNYTNLSKVANKAPDKQFLKLIHDIREPLEQQLDNVIGGDYKSLRKSYSELLGKEERLSWLFEKSKPGLDDSYTATGKLRKLFSNDKKQVLDEFKELEKLTGIKFTQKAQVAKFVEKEVAQRNSFNISVPHTLSMGAHTLNIGDKVMRRVAGKVTGSPLEIAQELVKDYKKLPSTARKQITDKISTVIKKISKGVIYKKGKIRDYTKEEANQMIQDVAK